MSVGSKTAMFYIIYATSASAWLLPSLESPCDSWARVSFMDSALENVPKALEMTFLICSHLYGDAVQRDAFTSMCLCASRRIACPSKFLFS